MKALKIVTAVSFLLFASTAVASEVPADNTVAKDSTVVTSIENEKALFNKLETGLIYNLNSNVHGVVESSLYDAVNFKITYPEFNSERVKEILARMAKEGDSHTLRYKAYLTLAYYQHPDQFGSPEALLSLMDYKYGDGIFFHLQTIVQANQFTSIIN